MVKFLQSTALLAIILAVSSKAACPKGMTMGCGNNCNRMCSNKFYGTSRIACPTYECRPENSSCQCDSSQDNWYDSDKKMCVPGSQCPTPKCSGPNQIFDLCPNSTCSPQTCDSVGKLYNCPEQPIPAVCKPACRCIDGYLKNSTGVCIPKKDCPCNGDANATSGCGVNCGRLCSNYNSATPAICPRICNVNGCDCRPGYVLNEKTKQCVLPKDCPKSETSCNGDPNAKPGCGVNCGRLCSNYNSAKPVFCPAICKENGCDCKQGYVLDDKTGKCILPKDCPKPAPTCGQNEELSKCKEGVCRIQDCSQKGIEISCIAVVPQNCTVGCLCKKNFLRNAQGVCVPECQCPVISCNGDPNAKPGCGVNCGRLCSNYNSAEQVFCPLICKENGCDCKQGYVLNDKTGKCILPKDCPKPANQCKANQEYAVCPTRCPVWKCGVNNTGVFCPRQPTAGDPSCPPPACVCKAGLYMNDQGDCVTWDQCPTCPKGTTLGCGNNCNRMCSNKFNGLSKLCPKIACTQKTSTCECDTTQDYWYDPIKKQCVRGSQCPKPNTNPQQCGNNERYSTCIQGECRPLTCDQRDQNLPCPRVIPEFCKKGCVCVEGYLQSANGTCIPEKDCGPCPGNGVWKTCPAEKCDAEYCPQSRNDPQACISTKECKKPRCTCPFNHKRNRETGECVLISDCPPFECNGPFETYQSCPSTCPGEKCSDYLNNSTCPKYRIGIVVPCQPQCRCNINYYRNNDGICISACQCKTTGGSTAPVTTAPVTTAPVTTAPDTTEAPDTTTAPPTSGSTGADLQPQLTQGINDYSINFTKEAISLQPGENSVMSGFSSLIPLATLFGFTKPDSESAKQLSVAVGLENKQQVEAAYTTLLESMQGGNGVNFTFAVETAVNDQYEITPEFTQYVENVFKSALQRINCNQPTEAAGQINSWVANKTNNLIPTLLPPTAISPLTRLVLVNAIYFKGQWKFQFNKNNTQKKDFHVDNKTTQQVDTMYIKQKFDVAQSEVLQATLLRLPYKNENFTMLVVLPNTIEGLAQTAASLNADTLQAGLDSMYNTECEVWLPKFKITSDIDLPKVWDALNIKDIMDSNKAELYGIVKDNDDKKSPLYVTGAFHKAFIDVNEEGSEAAAATAVVVGLAMAAFGPPPPPLQVIIDHPFLFFIMEDNNIVFSGKYCRD